MNLANLYEKNGKNAEADLMFTQCLQHYDRRYHEHRKSQQADMDVDGSNGSIPSNLDKYDEIRQQEKTKMGFEGSVNDKDVSVI